MRHTRLRFIAIVRNTMAIFLCAWLGGSCSPSGETVMAPERRHSLQSVDLTRAITAEESGADVVLALPGVTGIGAGVDQGRAVVVVFTESADFSGLPSRINGVRVVTQVTGTLRPFSLASVYRPVPIGVSAGNANECLPGTLGCVLQKGAHKYFLSANHVFARQNQAAIGEAIVQPSHPDADPACGPSPSSNVVGALTDFEPVVYDGHTPNIMDAAIAAVGMVKTTCATLPAYYGAPSATPAAAVGGMPIQKV
jgi:hypothetical protein